MFRFSYIVFSIVGIGPNVMLLVIVLFSRYHTYAKLVAAMSMIGLKEFSKEYLLMNWRASFPGWAQKPRQLFLNWYLPIL